MSEWEKREERRMWITPFFFLVLSFRGWKMREKKEKDKEKERKKIAGLLWSGLEMTVELNAGWETASSVRLLVKEITVLPSSPLLRGTQRLRLTRTYQVISGQADLSLSSLLPGPFSSQNTFFSRCLAFPPSSLPSSLLHLSVSPSTARRLGGSPRCNVCRARPRWPQTSRIGTSISAS